MLRKNCQIYFLDNSTLDLDDLDLKPLKKQGRYHSHANASWGEFLHIAPQADILIVNKFEIREKELAQLPHLKLICVCATGVNNIDLEACRKRHIGVCNVAGYSTTTVVEHTFAFLLALSHRVLEHHQAVLGGKWSGSPHFTLLDFPFSDLEGKTLGILGYGHIGKRVAKIGKGFGMKVLVGNIPGKAAKKIENLKRQSLKTLLQKSDFVTLHCPLSELTKGLMDAEKLSWMKPQAYLLNLARGPIVVESDLVQALRKNRIAGYAADVVEQEPIRANHPFLDPELRGKILLSPHIAWASRESRQRLVDEIGKNIEAFKNGKKRNRLV